jgi:flagellar biosynthetic protein FlhB
MGGELFGAVVALTKECAIGLADAGPDSASAVALLTERVAGRVCGIAARLGVIGVVMTIAMVAVHLLQTGALWAPARLAPEVSRLWSGMRGLGDEERTDGLARTVGAGVWSGVRAVVLLVAGGVFLVWHGGAFERLGTLEGGTLARGAGSLVHDLGVTLALAWAGLGVIDYGLQVRRFEAVLRMTRDEQREENRAIDGDPAIRSRRLKLARAWMRDPGELLTGASVLLTGRGGLAVLLAGGPPPGRITVRTIARGVGASTLRHGAERAGVPVVRAPELAAWFARPGAARRALPEELASRLAVVWPRSAGV